MRKKIIYWIGIIPFLLLFFCTSCSYGDKPNDAVIKEFESKVDYTFDSYKEYFAEYVSIDYKNVFLNYSIEYDFKGNNAVKLIYEFDSYFYKVELVEPKNSSFEVPVTIKFTPSEFNDKKSNEFSIERKLKIYEKKHYVDYYLNNTKTYKKDEVNNYECENDIYKWNEVGNIYSSWYTSNSKIESNNTLNLNELLFTSNYIRTMYEKNSSCKNVYYFNITYYVNTGIIEVTNRKEVFSSRLVYNGETHYQQYNIDLNKKDNIIHYDTKYILELLKRMDSFFYMYGLTDKVSPLYGTNYSTELIGTEKTDK